MAKVAATKSTTTTMGVGGTTSTVPRYDHPLPLKPTNNTNTPTSALPKAVKGASSTHSRPTPPPQQPSTSSTSSTSLPHSKHATDLTSAPGSNGVIRPFANQSSLPTPSSSSSAPTIDDVPSNPTHSLPLAPQAIPYNPFSRINGSNPPPPTASTSRGTTASRGGGGNIMTTNTSSNSNSNSTRGRSSRGSFSSSSRGGGGGGGGAHHHQHHQSHSSHQSHQQQTQQQPLVVDPSLTALYQPVVDPRILDPTRYWLLGQLEWWFSVDNLCRDLFLRSKVSFSFALLSSFSLSLSLFAIVPFLRSRYARRRKDEDEGVLNVNKS